MKYGSASFALSGAISAVCSGGLAQPATIAAAPSERPVPVDQVNLTPVSAPCHGC